MEECPLVEIGQLPTPVPLATHWVAFLHVPVHLVGLGVDLHQHAVSSITILGIFKYNHHANVHAVQCPLLFQPSGGTVSISSRAPGGRATYRCNTGNNLIGSATRSCLISGAWSGNAPTCQGSKCQYDFNNYKAVAVVAVIIIRLWLS